MKKGEKLLRKLSIGAVAFSLVFGMLTPASYAWSRNDYYYGNGYRDYYGNRYRPEGFLSNRPYVKKALIGGGIGAVVGGVATRNGDTVNGAIKGALIGAGVGLGYEYLRRNGGF